MQTSMPFTPNCGRDSIPPEKLLRTQLLMAFHTLRDECQLMEQIDLLISHSLTITDR